MKIKLWKFILACSFCMLSLNAYAEWHCYAADKEGHLWDSKGMIEEHASQVALNFCAAYSPNSGSCHISNCSERS